MDTVRSVKRYTRDVQEWHLRSNNAESILTDLGFPCMEKEYIAESRFDIAFCKHEYVTDIAVIGPVAAVLLSNDLASIKFTVSNATGWKMPRFDTSSTWNQVSVYFFPAKPDTSLKVRITHLEEVPLTPLQECFRDVEEDLICKCSDGEVRINSTLAKTTSEMLHGTLSFPSAPLWIDLTDYDVKTVTAVKGIMIERKITSEDLSPRVVELMHYLLVRDRNVVWRLIRQKLTVENAAGYFYLADKYDSAKTRRKAEDLLRQNLSKFEIADVAAFCSAIRMKSD